VIAIHYPDADCVNLPNYLMEGCLMTQFIASENNSCYQEQSSIGGAIMSYIGIFTLGLFVGWIVVQILKEPVVSQKAVAFILSAALGGVGIGAVDYFGGHTLGDALFTYPIGLVISLLWFYSYNAVEYITAQKPSLKVLGWAQLVGIVAATFVALSLVLPLHKLLFGLLPFINPAAN